MLAKIVRADGEKIRDHRKGQTCNKKRGRDEKPELQKLGLLRDPTKFSFNGHQPY